MYKQEKVIFQGKSQYQDFFVFQVFIFIFYIYVYIIFLNLLFIID